MLVMQGLRTWALIIPIGTFFRVSSVMLFAIAIYFAFEGVHEIQEGLEALQA